MSVCVCVFMSTSRAVRSAMRGWVVSDEGQRWSVKLDVRDLGSRLDTTFHGWSSTLASRVRLVNCSAECLSLPFHWIFMGGSGFSVPCLFLVLLHGIEASVLAGASVRKLRAAIIGVVWSRRQPCR